MCVYVYVCIHICHIYTHIYIHMCLCVHMCVCVLPVHICIWVSLVSGCVSADAWSCVCVCVLVSVSLRMCLGRWDCGSVCGWLYLSAGGGGAGVVDTMFPEKSQEQSYLLSYSLNLLCLHTVLSTNSTYRQAHSHTHIFLCLIDLHVSSILFLSPSFFPRTAS